jgi:hypothetical protein
MPAIVSRRGISMTDTWRLVRAAPDASVTLPETDPSLARASVMSMPPVSWPVLTLTVCAPSIPAAEG